MLIDGIYKTAARLEADGRDVRLGIEVNVAGIELTKEEQYVCHDALHALHETILIARTRSNPEAKRLKARLTQKLSACFPAPIHVRDIPNEYCSKWCCWDRPWLVVTTSRGPIKIGWRKRVISISWAESDIASTAEQLFPMESVTKEGRLIHASGYIDAKRYIRTILNSN